MIYNDAVLVGGLLRFTEYSTVPSLYFFYSMNARSIVVLIVFAMLIVLAKLENL